MQKNKQAQVFHFDLFGRREEKYDFLLQHSINDIQWSELEVKEPNYFFVRKNFEGINEYDKGFKIDELFVLSGSGIKTQRDDASIKFTKKECDEIKHDFLNLSNNELINKYQFIDVRDWKIDFAKADLKSNNIIANEIAFRPFDFRFMNYTGKTKGIMGYPRYDVMKHFLTGENVGLVVGRQSTDEYWCNVQVSKNIIDNRYHFSYKGISSQFPLYIYPEPNAQQTIDEPVGRVPNLNMEIVNQIADKLGLAFISEKTSPTPPKEGLSKPGYITANPMNYCLIKEMRDTLKDNPTEAEKVIWEYLRNKKTGHKIRRQHIIDDFITDFVCLRKKVVIEIDGKIHLKQKEYDELRTQCLNKSGYEVIRFTNEEVFANPDSVTLKIKEKLDTKPDFHNHDDSSSPPLEGPGEVFAPIDLLDFIYAVLHSPSYREKYKEFLKIDFPRVPYPKDKETFWQLVELGGEIRQIHLLESPEVNNFITKYPVGGTNEVGKVRYEILENETQNSDASTFGKVWINDEQYFANVPQIAWEFYIGGYQPAQKWLKDRKGRELQIEDILHYQKIIVALSETDRLMKEIDKIDL